MNDYDAVVLGAGGAGLMCALAAGRRGKTVAILDHAAKPGGKIIISGGGRCNFTNREVGAENFVSENEHFAKSALSRFTPEDFIAMVEARGIAYHERKHGQLFCDASAQQIIDLLLEECGKAGVKKIFLKHEIRSVAKTDGGYLVATDQGDFRGKSVVVATGGLSFAKFGATGIGYDIAKKFGLKFVATAPALDGFTLAPADKARFDLPGVALDAVMTTNGVSFQENLLFTHAGLSGPVALQASLHWRPGAEVVLDLLPAMTREELVEWLAARRGGRAELKNQMAALMPKRLAERFTDLDLSALVDMGNLPRKDVEAFAAKLKDFRFVPAGTVGYAKAEVTRGGVDTSELSSKTMEARKAPGLYFIGEVVDVTGWLGGFNYQWAWASGMAAGQAV